MAWMVRAHRVKQALAMEEREAAAREQSLERNNSLYNQQRPQPVDRNHCNAEPHDPHCIPLPPNTVPTLPNLQAWDQWPPNTGFANAVANANAASVNAYHHGYAANGDAAAYAEGEGGGDGDDDGESPTKKPRGRPPKGKSWSLEEKRWVETVEM